MAAFEYILNITGDCSHSGAGVIEILAVGGTPPYTYEWFLPSIPPVDILNETTPSIRTGLYYGDYFVRLSDSSALENNSFNVSAIVSSGCCVSITDVVSSTCGVDNGSVSVSATTYLSSVMFDLYSSGGTLLNQVESNTSTANFTNLSAGTYYVVATDIGGCSAKTSDFIVLNSSELTFGLYTVPNSACSPIGDPIGKIIVTGQTGLAPYTYVWSNNATGSTVTGLTSGFYSVTVTDSNGCSATENTFLPDVDPLAFVYFSAQTPSCFASDGALRMFITGGTAPYYYSASTGEVLISYAQNFLLDNIPAGTYSFLVTDAGLCQVSSTTSLQTPQSLGEISVISTNSTCSNDDGSISIFVGQGIGPFTYTLIYPDSTTESSTTLLPSKIFNGLSTGDYEVIISNPETCVYQQSVSLITNNLFTISTSVTGATCNFDNGTIQISQSTGGTEPFNYYVDDVLYYSETALTSVTIEGVFSPGTHIVRVIDANGCEQNQDVYVTTTPPLNFNLFTTGCGSGAQGSITAFISSGTPPFTFNWSDNVAGNPQSITASNLTAGTYTLIIQDSYGCSLERQTIIACQGLTSGYLTYPVGTQELQANEELSSGLLELLNDGFQDLISGNTMCIFNSANFIANVEVSPVGLLLQNTFYTSTSLTDVPANNLWYTAIENLLITVPGVQSVNIDSLTGEISIIKSPTNLYLNGQVINISLEIDYDINC